MQQRLALPVQELFLEFVNVFSRRARYYAMKSRALSFVSRSPAMQFVPKHFASALWPGSESQSGEEFQHLFKAHRSDGSTCMTGSLGTTSWVVLLGLQLADFQRFSFSTCFLAQPCRHEVSKDNFCKVSLLLESDMCLGPLNC